MRIVEKLKKDRRFCSVQASDCWIILVRVIFPSKLSIVYFNFRLRCTQSKSEDGERLSRCEISVIGIVF